MGKGESAIDHTQQSEQVGGAVHEHDKEHCKLPKTTCEPDGEVAIRLDLDKQDPKTVMSLLDEAAAKHPNKEAMRQKVNGEWKSWTWNEYRETVLNTARGFMALGLKPHQAVSIIGFNSPEWVFADLGAIAAGGMAAGIYSTNGTAACQYIVEHSESSIVVCEDKKQLEKFLAVKCELKNVKAYVVWSGEVPEEDNVYSWSQLQEMGSSTSQADLDARIAAQRPGHCSTLIYTSGTTGNPKAVMISHDNAVWTAWKTCQHLGFDSNEHLISYLPLSHIAAQMVDIYAPLTAGCTVHFAQPDVLRGSLLQTLLEVRPTAFFGVPRVWEKIQEGLMKKAPPAGSTKAKISAWAKGVGLVGYYAEQEGKSKGISYAVANAIVFKKIRVAMGLDRCRFLLTGAAPISKETLEYFGQLNLPIKELFGMSETSGPTNISTHTPGEFKTGYCGAVLPGTRTEIAEGTGEIIFTGRHIMMGYLKNEAATSDTIDADGWCHSGDIGAIDDGLLKVTGRIKELLITGGGENVAPVPIEDTIKKHLPAVSNVMVIGDKRKFLSCIVTLKTTPTPDGLGFTNQLDGAATKVADATTVEEAMASAEFKKYVEAGIAAANKEAVSNAQKVQKFIFVAKDFSVAGGELTPTMKLKRKVVSEMYAAEIEAMYA